MAPHTTQRDPQVRRDRADGKWVRRCRGAGWTGWRREAQPRNCDKWSEPALSTGISRCRRAAFPHNRSSGAVCHPAARPSFLFANLNSKWFSVTSCVGLISSLVALVPWRRSKPSPEGPLGQQAGLSWVCPALQPTPCSLCPEHWFWCISLIVLLFGPLPPLPILRRRSPQMRAQRRLLPSLLPSARLPPFSGREFRL